MKLYELIDNKTFYGFKMFLFSLSLRAVSIYFNFVMVSTNMCAITYKFIRYFLYIYFIIMLVLLDVCTIFDRAVIADNCV